jgi:hypothetical protein
MAETLYGVIGPVSQADGTYARMRQDKNGAVVVTDAHGRHYEAASRGKLFAAVYSAGQAPGATITTTAPAVLYNPAGSGILVAIKRVRVAYVSGTLGSGTMFACVNGTTNQTAPSGGNAVTGINLCAGNAAAATAVYRSGATVVAPSAVFPIGSLTPVLATTANNPWLIDADLDGEIVLAAGTTFQVQSIAGAGTSPIVAIGISWEEIAVP